MLALDEGTLTLIKVLRIGVCSLIKIKKYRVSPHYGYGSRTHKLFLCPVRWLNLEVECKSSTALQPLFFRSVAAVLFKNVRLSDGHFRRQNTRSR